MNELLNSLSKYIMHHLPSVESIKLFYVRL